eukprot:Polyplicarium_translucidae@DN5311_c0_g1_i1.p2
MRRAVASVAVVAAVAAVFSSGWRAMEWVASRGADDPRPPHDRSSSADDEFNMCGRDMRWRDLGAAFQNEYLGGASDGVAPIYWSCAQRRDCRGVGDRFRGIETMYH